MHKNQFAPGPTLDRAVELTAYQTCWSGGGWLCPSLGTPLLDLLSCEPCVSPLHVTSAFGRTAASSYMDGSKHCFTTVYRVKQVTKVNVC